MPANNPEDFPPLGAESNATAGEKRRLRAFAAMLAVVATATLWSAVQPHDYPTWAFELVVGWLGIAILAATVRRFRFSSVAYAVIAIHFVILARGAKYTYAEEPIFGWLQQQFPGTRNHFDRVGHFAQGLTPALLTRELLLRTTPLRQPGWVRFLAMCVALAGSACYEILEWQWVIWFYPQNGPEWLGMQGDPWDAQGDMLMAGLGGWTATSLLSRWHDRALRSLQS